MMRRTRRLGDYPPLPWVNPDQCLYPAPVTLLKLDEADETLKASRSPIMTMTDLFHSRPRLPQQAPHVKKLVLGHALSIA